MQYSRLGQTGLVVSRLAFGAMTFGEGQLVPGVTNRIGQDAADRMVAQALDAGINLFDTADAYTGGQSEEMLGRALGRRRTEAIIVTKCGFRAGDALTDTGLSHRHVLMAAEQSLRRLGTDFIDIYLIHISDPLTPLEETARALDDLVRRGLVRYVGFSNLPAWKAARFVGLQERYGWARFATAQMYYSLLGRDLEHEVVPFCEDAGIGIMAWSPLAGGFLSGKYTRENPNPAGARLNEFKIPPIDLETGYAVVDLLRDIAGPLNATPAQVALAWMLRKRFIASILVGANSEAHLSNNLAAVDVALSDQDVARLDARTTPPALYPGWMQAMGWDGRVRAALDTVAGAPDGGL